MHASPAIRSWIRLQLCLLALLSLPASAVILLTGDNTANRTAPDPARTDIFNAVAKVCNASGGGAYGSAVHLRGKYMLTARHVNVEGAGHVTFDGSTIHARDAAFVPVVFGTADLKLFKLVQDPGLPEVKLFSAANGDIPYTTGPPPVTHYTTATIVGAGVGRSPADDGLDTVWVWGDGSTMAKRWGENRIESEVNPLEYLHNGINYSFSALETTLETNAGDNEAAVTVYDSGCGLFVEEAGEWKLAGIAVTVSTNGSSNFNNTTGDGNQFVRITTYAAAIEAAIPDPTTYAGWKIDHSLYGGDAADDADTDGDGIPQLMEYALGANPKQPDRNKLPLHQFTEEGGGNYLELVVTRPIGLQGLSYVPQTATDLATWPVDSTGIVNASPTPTNNNDGTETLVYRRAAAVASNQRAFIRLKVASN